MQQFLAINPYKVGPPVTGGDFYGRNDLLRKVRDTLYSSNVVLLQGQRRIGKTSFLKTLAAVLKGGLSQFPIIFDIQRYIQDSLPQFQLHLAETIARELPLPPLPALAELEANPVLFQDTWLPQLYKYLGDRNLVILVDEFDNLSDKDAPQAMENLVAFLGQLVETESQIKWVFTLGRETGKLPIQYDTIISTGKQFRLSFLSLEETRQLIEEPVAGILTYQPEAVERIYQLTSGQPHLTQALASEVFQLVVLEEERNNATKEDVESVISETLEAYSGTIASIVRVPILEERVLATVAQLTKGGKSAKREEIIDLLVQSQIEINRDELTNTLASLLKWELLAGNEQEVRLSVELVRRWIVKHLSVELSREQSLNLNYALAQSRFEFAEKARQAGRYDLAIKDYKEALEVIPNHVEALRGLAESYRLIGDWAGRVTTLETLSLYERSVFNELINTFSEYAQTLEEKQDFSAAAEQYQKLAKLDNKKQWYQKFALNILNYFDNFSHELKETSSKNKPSIPWDRLDQLRTELIKLKRDLIIATEKIEDLEWARQINSRLNKSELELLKILKNIGWVKYEAMSNNEAYLLSSLANLLTAYKNAGGNLTDKQEEKIQEYQEYQKYEQRENIYYLVSSKANLVAASRYSLQELCKPLSSPYYSAFENGFTNYRLRPFSEKELLLLLQRVENTPQPPFSAAEIRYVTYLSGCHPQLAQIAAAEIFNQRLETGEPLPQATLEAGVGERFKGESRLVFEGLWQGTSEVERLLLMLVALQKYQGKLPKVQYDLSDLSEIFSQREREIVELTERGLLNRSQSNPYVWDIFCPMFQWWILKEIESSNPEQLNERRRIWGNLITQKRADKLIDIVEIIQKNREAIESLGRSILRIAGWEFPQLPSV